MIDLLAGFLGGMTLIMFGPMFWAMDLILTNSTAITPGLAFGASLPFEIVWIALLIRFLGWLFD